MGITDEGILVDQRVWRWIVRTSLFVVLHLDITVGWILQSCIATILILEWSVFALFGYFR